MGLVACRMFGTVNKRLVEFAPSQSLVTREMHRPPFVAGKARGGPFLFSPTLRRGFSTIAIRLDRERFESRGFNSRQAAEPDCLLRGRLAGAARLEPLPRVPLGSSASRA
jgi:hypothetical protein